MLLKNPAGSLPKVSDKAYVSESAVIKYDKLFKLTKKYKHSCEIKSVNAIRRTLLSQITMFRISIYEN